MTNVVKHADANEVVKEMVYHENKVLYSLQDNGS
jgi:signal transduction histidine kinase